MAIHFHSEKISIPYFFRKKRTSLWIKAVVNSFRQEVNNINYIFCNDEYLLEINKKYLDHDTYTDIITFDYSDDNSISGDIYISLERVFENAKELNTPKQQELNRVIIHGILHLCGLKDKTRAEKENMRQKEDESLSLLSTMV